ncbi:MAG: alpha/beta fold hydrolase [Myxococcales bacterium]|nr:alpha/beta fold hydrolase [Myxococcales bacterium]
MGEKLDMTLAILNGLVGDHLVRTDNPLATELGFVQDGEPEPAEVACAALAAPTPKVVVLVHGLMCTETIWRMDDGSDYGSRLARDLGFTPLYVRYNSGRPIADNGAALSAALADLVRVYPAPIEELLLLGYSMGGLLVRSACHTAKLGDLGWLGLVRRAIYVGTPHRGAPLERAGRVLTRFLRAVPDPYTRLAADLGDLRSAGVKDLGDADLTHEDRARTRERARFSLRDPRHPVPLLPDIEHYLAAGTLHGDPRVALYFGDAMVPVPSATFDGAARGGGDGPALALAPERVRVFEGYSHVRLAHDPAVYDRIKAWCET